MICAIIMKCVMLTQTLLRILQNAVNNNEVLLALGGVPF